MWKPTRPGHFTGDRAPRSPTRFPTEGSMDGDWRSAARLQGRRTPTQHAPRVRPAARAEKKQKFLLLNSAGCFQGHLWEGISIPAPWDLTRPGWNQEGRVPKQSRRGWAKTRRVWPQGFVDEASPGRCHTPSPSSPRGPGLSPTSPAEGPSAPHHRPAALFSFFFSLTHVRHLEQTTFLRHVYRDPGEGPLCSAPAAQVTTGVHLPRPEPFRLPQSRRACVEGGLRTHFTLFLKAVTLPSAPAPHRLAPRPPAVRKGRGWAAEAPRGRRETGGRRVAGPAGLGSARWGAGRVGKGRAGRRAEASPSLLPFLPHPARVPVRCGGAEMAAAWGGRGGAEGGEAGEGSPQHTPRRSAEGRRAAAGGFLGKEGDGPGGNTGRGAAASPGFASESSRPVTAAATNPTLLLRPPPPPSARRGTGALRGRTETPPEVGRAGVEEHSSGTRDVEVLRAPPPGKKACAGDGGHKCPLCPQDERCSRRRCCCAPVSAPERKGLTCEQVSSRCGRTDGAMAYGAWPGSACGFPPLCTRKCSIQQMKAKGTRKAVWSLYCGTC